MKRALIAPIYLLALVAVIPTSALAKKLPTEPLGSPSKAVTNDILDAVAEEMNRAMTQLEIPGAPKPYHIAYKITEVDVNDSAASLGYTTSKRNRHFVNLEARVRVGSPQLDNSNFAVPQADEIDAVSAINLPLEATPRIARRAAWLVTDAAYKEALIQLRAKLESRRAGSSRPSDVPSWTAEKPLVSEDPVLVPVLEPLDELEARAKAISAVFRDQPQLRDSRVAVTSYLERRWYLTTEGTSVTDTRRASGVVIAASGQADDGQLLQPVLPALRPHREGPADRRRAQGRGEEADRDDRPAREGAGDGALLRSRAVRGRRRGRPAPVRARTAPRRHPRARGHQPAGSEDVRRPLDRQGRPQGRLAEPLDRRRSDRARGRRQGADRRLQDRRRGRRRPARRGRQGRHAQDAADEPDPVAEGPDLERPRAADRRRRRVPRQRDQPVRPRQGRGATQGARAEAGRRGARRGPQVWPDRSAGSTTRRSPRPPSSRAASSCR